jgi:hypothetical protein
MACPPDSAGVADHLEVLALKAILQCGSQFIRMFLSHVGSCCARMVFRGSPV